MTTRSAHRGGPHPTRDTRPDAPSPELPNDGEAILALRNGDESQWRRVAAIVLRLAGYDRDVAQDALVRVLLRLEQLDVDHPGAAFVWARRVVRTVKIDAIRARTRARRARPTAAIERLAVTVPQSDELEPQALLEALDGLLVELRPSDRRKADASLAVHVLRESPSVVAELHGVSTCCATQWAKRGRDDVLLPAIGDRDELAALREALMRSRRADHGKARPRRRRAS